MSLTFEMEEVMEKLTKKNCVIATAVSKIKSPADKLWENFGALVCVKKIS